MRMDWICKMSTGFLKHGFVKGGLFIKHGLLLPIDTLKKYSYLSSSLRRSACFSRVYWMHNIHFIMYLS